MLFLAPKHVCVPGCCPAVAVVSYWIAQHIGEGTLRVHEAAQKTADSGDHVRDAYYGPVPLLRILCVSGAGTRSLQFCQHFSLRP